MVLNRESIRAFALEVSFLFSKLSSRPPTKGFLNFQSDYASQPADDSHISPSLHQTGANLLPKFEHVEDQLRTKSETRFERIQSRFRMKP